MTEEVAATGRISRTTRTFILLSFNYHRRAKRNPFVSILSNHLGLLQKKTPLRSVFANTEPQGVVTTSDVNLTSISCHANFLSLTSKAYLKSSFATRSHTASSKALRARQRWWWSRWWWIWRGVDCYHTSFTAPHCAGWAVLFSTLPG